MMPKNTLRPHRLRRLRIFADEEGVERYSSQLVGSARLAEDFVEATAPHGMAPKSKPETGDLARDFIPESVADLIGEEEFARVKTWRELESKYGIMAKDFELEDDAEYQAEMEELFSRLLAEEQAGSGSSGAGEDGESAPR